MAKYEYGTTKNIILKENLKEKAVKAKVVRIQDGDTIYVTSSDSIFDGLTAMDDGSYSIRLSGVQAPEGTSFWNTKDEKFGYKNYEDYKYTGYEEKESFSEESFMFVKDLLFQKEVLLDLRTREDGSLVTGRFSRPVAICFVRTEDGDYINVNVSLLINGLASPYYVESMNISDREKKEWSSLSLIAAMNRVEKETEKEIEMTDSFVGYLNPEKNIKIGDTILPIPPEAIQVTDINELNPSGVLRNGSTLMSSTGHRQKQIQMDFYFDSNKKTKEIINGKVYEGDQVNGFPKKAGGLYSEIKQDGKTFRPIYYINGLRPLIAQFKLTPFLPVENNYLNKAHDISALTLQNLIVSNVEGFPGLLKATLIALEFNHQAYINTLAPFKDIFDWKLFRFYYQRIIKGTGIKHSGTKLPFYYPDGEDFSFLTVDSWSLQKRENLENSLKNMLREYQIDLKNGTTEYEKLVHDMELFTEAYSQYELYQKMKENYNLDDTKSIDALFEDYTAEVLGRKRVSDATEGIFYYPDIEPHAEIAERYPAYSVNIREYMNINDDEDTFSIRLRGEKNKEFLINSIREKEDRLLSSYEIEKIKMMSDKEIEKIKEDDIFEAFISKETFLGIRKRIMSAGEDMEKEREDAVNMTDNQMTEYEWNKHHYQGLFLNQISLSLSNSVNTLKLNMQQKPAHQYLGSRDIVISTSFITESDEIVESLNFLASHISALELRYKNILDNPVLKIENNIVDIFGLDGAYIKNIETNTIPGMPGLKQIEISFFGYFDAKENKDSLSLKYRTELGVDGKMGEDSLTDYFNMKEMLNYVNLYPDLELPRYSELPIKHPLYDENDNRWVEPDFYALNVPKLFIEDVAKSVYFDKSNKIIGRDLGGNVVTAEVDNEGNLNIGDSVKDFEVEKPSLNQLLEKYGTLDYNVLNQFVKNEDKYSSRLNSKTFVTEEEFKGYISAAGWKNSVFQKNIKVKDLWENSHMQQVFDVAEGGIFKKGGKVPDIEKIILSGFVAGKWDREYFKDENTLITPDGELLRDKDGKKTNSLTFAYTAGVIGLPKSVLDRESIKKVAADYRASVLKLELEAGKIYTVLKENSPEINFEEDENNGETLEVTKSYHENSKKNYIDYLFKITSYFLVYGIPLNEIAENKNSFYSMKEEIKKGYEMLDKNAMGIMGSEMYVAPVEMLELLPQFATLIMESLSSINGSRLILTSNGSLLQSREESVRFQAAFNDMMEYDKKGRLIRAFPSYYMLLVDEGREFMFWKMQDLFYEYNGIESIDVVRDKKNVADSCMITMSNSKEKLSDAAGGYRNKYYNERGVVETLWSLTPFAEFEWEKKKRNSKMESVQLATGARIHLRMGYGSTPDKLPTIFNGTITELQLGDKITFVAQNDGIELNKPIPSSPNEKTDFEFFGALDEPKTIISKILGDRGNLWSKFMNNVSGGLLYNDSLYGVQHFGAVKRPEWWNKSSYIRQRHPDKDIYINKFQSDKTKTVQKDIERGFEVNQNINSSLYESKEISMYLYGKTIYDMLQTSALVAPNYIAAVHPFAFRNTIFYGHPNFDFAYDYEAKKDSLGNYLRIESREVEKELFFSGNGYQKKFELGKNIIENSLTAYDKDKNITAEIEKIDYQNGNVNFKNAPSDGLRNVKFKFKTLNKGRIDPAGVREKIKPYRQMHFYSSFYDIVANNIIATDKNMYTVVKPVLSKDGSYKELDSMFVDTDIFPSKQKLKKIDTSIPSPDFLRWVTNGVRLTDKNSEINAKRYGAGSLKQAVQNMYDGEILITGDPTAKPYDYAYLADVATRMSGTFEVSAVVHSLNDSTGFITSIKPSPIVSVNEGLDTDVKFWNWSKSKFSKIYANSVIARMSAYTALETLKTVINSLKSTATNGLLAPTQAGRAMSSYLDVTTDAVRHSNLGYLPYLFGEKAVTKIKNIGTKTDNFILWMQRFLDNANSMSEMAKLSKAGSIKDFASIKGAMVAAEHADKAAKASDSLLSLRNGYLRVGEYISDAYNNVDDFPGLVRDINKYKSLRKAGMAAGDILDDVKTFKRVLTYGMQGGKNIARIASGPIGFLAMELLEIVIVGKIMDFFNNVRNDREVLTIMPLTHNGSEFSAGLDGHKGCVVGDDPSEMDEFWEGSLVSFFLGESKTSDNRSMMRNNLILDDELIKESAGLYGSAKSAELESRVIGVADSEDVKKVFSETMMLNFESIDSKDNKTVSTIEIKEDKNSGTKTVEKKEETKKEVKIKKSSEKKSLRDINHSSKKEWSQKAAKFVEEDEKALREYQGKKIEPRLLGFALDAMSGLSSKDVKLEFGQDVKTGNSLDRLLFDSGLAIRFSPLLGSGYPVIKKLDTADVVSIMKKAASHGIKSIKIFRDNTVQVDLYPLNDTSKLKTAEYNMSQDGLHKDVIEVIDTYF